MRSREPHHDAGDRDEPGPALGDGGAAGDALQGVGADLRGGTRGGDAARVLRDRVAAAVRVRGHRKEGQLQEEGAG